MLMPLLRGEAVDFKGERFRVNAQLSVPCAPPVPPVLLAALGTRMLRLCGAHTDGTITWMVGPRTLQSAGISCRRSIPKPRGGRARGAVESWSACQCASRMTLKPHNRARRATTSATARCRRTAPCWIARASRVASRGGRHRVGTRQYASDWRPWSRRVLTDFYPAVFRLGRGAGRGRSPSWKRWRPMDDSPRSNRPTPRTLRGDRGRAAATGARGTGARAHRGGRRADRPGALASVIARVISAALDVALRGPGATSATRPHQSSKTWRSASGPRAGGRREFEEGEQRVSVSRDFRRAASGGPEPTARWT